MFSAVCPLLDCYFVFFFFQAEDGIRDVAVTGVQTCALPILAKFTRMSILEPSHFAAGAAYLAANRYQQDDFQPYLFKTTDYGKTWTRITAGIPAGAYTRVIREDPVRRGLLFAGTETGIYVSLDDGARWQSLQLNLPRSSVRDIAIHESDLIVATHGRAFWVLDDISPLRQLSDQVRGASAHLFTRSEEHTSELQSRLHLVCRLLLEKKKIKTKLVDRSYTQL